MYHKVTNFSSNKMPYYFRYLCIKFWSLNSQRFQANPLPHYYGNPGCHPFLVAEIPSTSICSSLNQHDIFTILIALFFLC